LSLRIIMNGGIYKSCVMRCWRKDIQKYHFFAK
jgi:hypothetical protein